MPESWSTRLQRWTFNLFPAYRRTGGRITYVAGDFREVHVRLPLNWKTRNYVGTIFGGSLYGAVDPIYMIMFIKLLGDGYVVWDKAAEIRFLRPGRSALHARFRVEREEVSDIRERLNPGASTDRSYEVQLVDEHGRVCAVVGKTLYFRRKAVP